MTKAEMIGMLEKIREAANSHSCNMCPCEPFLCWYDSENQPCDWNDGEIKEFVDAVFKSLEIREEE